MTCFRRLWLAQSVSLAGDLVAVFAVQVAITFRMRGSARDVAGVFIAGLIPHIVLGPLSGTIADRSDPKRLMIVSDLLRAGLVLPLPWTGTIREIYAISGAIGCLSSCFLPAQAITLPLLVPSERLFAAVAQMQQTTQLVRLGSPFLASALVAACGVRACYYADAGSFLFSAALLATLRFDHRPAKRGATPMTSGVKLLLHPRFSSVLWPLTAATFAATCFSSLASVYVRDVLQRGPSMLAAIGSLIGAGTLAGSAVLSRFRIRDIRRLIAAGMAGAGVCILLLGAIPNTKVAAIAAAGLGVSAAMVMTAASALLLGQTPAGLRGRVSAASGSLTGCAQLSAMVLAATCASWIGIRGVLLASAAVLFATAGTLKLGKIHRAAAGGNAPEIIDLPEMVVEMPVQVNEELSRGKRAAEDNPRERAA